MEHTKEPWFVDPMEGSDSCLDIKQGDGWYVATTHGGVEGIENAEANARRIVVCVNACAGIGTKELELMRHSGLERAVIVHASLVERLHDVEKQCDKLTEQNNAMHTELNTAWQQIKTEQRLSFRDQVAKMERQRDELLALVMRYRKETPLGTSPT